MNVIRKLSVILVDVPLNKENSLNLHVRIRSRQLIINEKLKRFERYNEKSPLEDEVEKLRSLIIEIVNLI